MTSEQVDALIRSGIVIRFSSQDMMLSVDCSPVALDRLWHPILNAITAAGHQAMRYKMHTNSPDTDRNRRGTKAPPRMLSSEGQYTSIRPLHMIETTSR